MFAKKSTKNDEIYIFKKPMGHDHAISNMQKIAKILITWSVINKTKNVDISFDRLFARKLQIFLVQSVSLLQRLSIKLKIIKIWQVEVGQNKDIVCYRKKSHSGSLPEDSDS